MKIALLEPNPAIREMLVMALDLRGHTVASFADPFAFLRCALSGAYDVALVDDHSEIRGEQVIRVLVASRLPCVLMSTTPAARRHTRASTPGDVPFLEKPFHLVDLFAALESVALLSLV